MPTFHQAKTTLRKYWENFFRNYALFYMRGGGIYGNYCISLLCIQNGPVVKYYFADFFRWGLSSFYNSQFGDFEC